MSISTNSHYLQSNTHSQSFLTKPKLVFDLSDFRLSYLKGTKDDISMKRLDINKNQLMKIFCDEYNLDENVFNEFLQKQATILAFYQKTLLALCEDSKIDKKKIPEDATQKLLQVFLKTFFENCQKAFNLPEWIIYSINGSAISAELQCRERIKTKGEAERFDVVTATVTGKADLGVFENDQPLSWESAISYFELKRSQDKFYRRSANQEKDQLIAESVVMLKIKEQQSADQSTPLISSILSDAFIFYLLIAFKRKDQLPVFLMSRSIYDRDLILLLMLVANCSNKPAFANYFKNLDDSEDLKYSDAEEDNTDENMIAPTSDSNKLDFIESDNEDPDLEDLPQRKKAKKSSTSIQQQNKSNPKGTKNSSGKSSTHVLDATALMKLSPGEVEELFNNENHNNFVINYDLRAMEREEEKEELREKMRSFSRKLYPNLRALTTESLHDKEDQFKEIENSSHPAELDLESKIRFLMR